jgi:GcrA cell cycle regulator
MQSTNWTEEHSKALREFLESGMSYARIADAINAKFQTAYSRNATIGRANRMGLASPDRPSDCPKPPPRAKPPQLHKLHERVPESMRLMPMFEREETVKLRCVENPAIADIPTAATRKTKPLVSAVTRSAGARATAWRIFI